MKILLFLIYGSKRSYQLELTYSVLSAYQFLQNDPAGITLMLATDEGNERYDLPVENIIISQEQLNIWQMDGKYPHAVKPQILQYILRQKEAPVILTDTDTIFHRHPKEIFEKISEDQSVMHAAEGHLRDSMEWEEWENVIRQSGGQLADMPVSPDTIMFNSGVIGVHPVNQDVFSQAADVIYEVRRYSSVFTAEQLAVSLLLAKRTRLVTCADAVEHYWSKSRAFYHYQMDRMFPRTGDENRVEISDTTILDLARSPDAAVGNRLLAQMKRIQRHSSAEYGYAYLCYLSALSNQVSDPELANVWAENALGMLKWGVLKKVPATPKDFVAFAPEKIKLAKWMTPRLRELWENYWTEWNAKSSTR